MLVALLTVILVHPQIVGFAKKKNIVDNPDARKLQRSPVPVMGGVAVFVGLAVGLSMIGVYNVVLPLCLDALSSSLVFEPLNIVNLLPMFLGMSKAVVKGHGNSKARAFSVCISQATEAVKGDMVGKIKAMLDELTAAQTKTAEENA